MLEQQLAASGSALGQDGPLQLCGAGEFGIASLFPFHPPPLPSHFQTCSLGVWAFLPSPSYLNNAHSQEEIKYSLLICEFGFQAVC